MKCAKTMVAWGVGMLMVGLSACSNIDCPLDNVVSLQCNLYDASTQSALTLSDVLSVTPAGRDTLLLNQATGIKSFLLPLKEVGTQDTLLLHFANAQGAVQVDTLFVNHTPQPHFESLDCPNSVFHTLNAVRVSAQGSANSAIVDSVSLVRPIVNYDDIENIRLFIRTSAAK